MMPNYWAGQVCIRVACSSTRPTMNSYLPRLRLTLSPMVLLAFAKSLMFWSESIKPTTIEQLIIYFRMATGTPNPNEYIPVKKDLTSKNSYRLMAESAERREKIFQEFLVYVRAQYNHFKVFCTQLQDHDYLLFNDHINDAFDLITECWSEELLKLFNQDVRKVQDVNHNPEYQLPLPLQCTLNQAQKFESLQDQLIAQLKQQNKSIQAFADNAKSYASKRQLTILDFFNPNYLRGPYAEMSKKCQQIEETEVKNIKLISQVEKNKVKFLSTLGNFRKEVLRNRFLFEKKFYDVCTILVEGIKKKSSQLLSKMKVAKRQIQRKDSSVEHSRNENSSMREQKSQFYNRIAVDELFSVCSWLRNVSSSMHAALSNSKEERTKFNKKFCALMKVQDSFPSYILNFFLETYEKVLGRFTQIANNLHRKMEYLEELQSRMSDHGRSTIASNHQSHLRKTKSSNLSRIPTVSSVTAGIFEDIIDPLMKLVNWADTSLTKEKRMQLGQSMVNRDVARMSFQNGMSEEIHEQEAWMFEDWKQSTSIKSINLPQVKKQLNKIKELIQKQTVDEGRQLVKPQKCKLLVMNSPKKAGVLHVHENCLKFVSSEDSYVLSVPYEAINQVKHKVLKSKLSIYTAQGKISFMSPERAKESKERISERLKGQRGSDNNNVNEQETNTQADEANNGENKTPNKTPKWKSVELTPAEQSGMEARKTKVVAELPDVTNWIEANPPHTFKNIGIDQFYNEIYSDAPKEIRGKKYQCFYQYLFEAIGNTSNFEFGKYNPQGPKFYTQEDGQTFQTCPSFSERTNTYERALKNFPIPFMPKFMKCKEVVKTYWISNEQFAVVTEASSTGMSVIESFYVKFIHHARKKGDDVEVSYHVTIVWIKDSTFKRILENKCLEQIKKNYPNLIRIQWERARSAVSGKGGQQQQAPVVANSESKGLEKQESKVSDTVGSAPVSSSNPIHNSRIVQLLVGVIAMLLLMKVFKLLFP